MTPTVTAPSSSIASISYQDLYRRWEDGHWKAYAIDFSADRDGWRALTEIQRRSALWLYSMFYYGEDSVTDNLSPYIDAAPTEEQSYFLATQQVDEARHAVFFHRFFREVMGIEGSIADTLASTAPALGWGYRKVFDRLDRMAAELRRDRSLPKFAQAITLYHLVVEAAMAQPGQHFIEDFFVKEGTLPGFSEGMRNVSRDEQRHIGFGVKTLSEALAESDECRAAVVELLREVMPWTSAVFAPPGWDRSYTRAYGFELEDIFAWAIGSVKSKWRTIGFPIEDMPGVLPFGPEDPDREVAERILKLLEAGALGPPNGRPDSSPEIQRLFFEVVANSTDPARANGGLAVQWRFADAESWHVRIENGTSRAEPGETADADVVLDTDWATWIGLAMGEGDPRRALISRRLRPHGSPLKLLRMSRVFPRMPSLLPSFLGR